MRAMMLVVVEVSTIDHAGYIQREVERFVENALRESMAGLPRFLRDKPYARNVKVEPFGEGSVAGLLADEVQRLRTIADALERKSRT